MKRKIGQKVYVLNGGCIGDQYVVGVFSSKKKAQEAREWIIENDTYYKSNHQHRAKLSAYLNPLIQKFYNRVDQQ